MKYVIKNKHFYRRGFGCVHQDQVLAGITILVWIEQPGTVVCDTAWLAGVSNQNGACLDSRASACNRCLHV